MLYCIIGWFTKYIYTQVEQNILVLNVTFILKDAWEYLELNEEALLIP